MSHNPKNNAKQPKKRKTKSDLDDLIGKPKKAGVRKGAAAHWGAKKVKEDLDDLIGKPPKKAKVKKPADDLSDLIGTPRPKKVVEIGEVGYTPMVKPKNPHPNGLWARREQKGKNWGVTCLECNDKLIYRGGRPPVVCKKKDCFRTYRNLYRRDYEKAAA